jgi:hypothetical protein
MRARIYSSRLGLSMINGKIRSISSLNNVDLTDRVTVGENKTLPVLKTIHHTPNLTSWVNI